MAQSKTLRLATLHNFPAFHLPFTFLFSLPIATTSFLCHQKLVALFDLISCVFLTNTNTQMKPQLHAAYISFFDKNTASLAQWQTRGKVLDGREVRTQFVNENRQVKFPSVFFFFFSKHVFFLLAC
jgi:hypothetical protein